MPETIEAPAREFTPPPHFCPDCGDQLCKLDIYDTKARRGLGHVWHCEECDKHWVGYGDPNEFKGD